MNLFKLVADLEAVDGEAVEKIAYYSRRQMLSSATARLAKMTTGAAIATFGTVMNQAFGQTSSATDVLNFALTLEYLESDYYTKALATSGLIPATDLAIFQQIAKHEAAHVTLLAGALGTAAVKKPTFKYDASIFATYQNFLTYAQAFEDTGVRAYKGQAGNLLGTATLTTALQIHSVEARHASEVRRLRGLKGWISASTETPAAVYAGETNMTQATVNVRGIASLSAVSDLAIQEAFDEPLDKASVLAIAGPYIAA